MAAYIVSELEVRDHELMESYRSLAARSIAQYGGRYLARGGTAELIEGSPPPRMIVIVEFPSMAAATEWYASPAYAEALKFRKDALDRRLLLVEGVPPVSGT